jgi:dGTP triphosphohydrolase
LFPPYYSEPLVGAANDNDQEKKRVVVDLIAGMTEEQALGWRRMILAGSWPITIFKPRG